MPEQITISRAMEDYLKAIYQLSIEIDRVSTSQLAERMKCTPASVTNMLQKLSGLKVVEYAPYQGVKLTPAGRKIALEVIRHHRLLELYLSEVLGYSWDQVHAEAEELEHFISEEFEARIDEALGFPDRDPHGDPIPTKDLEISTERFLSLWEAESGQGLTVRRVNDDNPEMLRYLASIGIYPDVQLIVVEKAPFNGPVHIQIDSGQHSLGEELARQIFVTPT
ncbi:MAG TPA: metal-dependent transcriptional regulator [Acidobacteriota bacterium]|nr:metal-dependent transcriptional regulator [Acidobacteriota bacterium]